MPLAWPSKRKVVGAVTQKCGSGRPLAKPAVASQGGWTLRIACAVCQETLTGAGETPLPVIG